MYINFFFLFIANKNRDERQLLRGTLVIRVVRHVLELKPSANESIRIPIDMDQSERRILYWVAVLTNPWALITEVNYSS
jgi:hypothetical protein